ncbi:MAG: capsule biosynthesis protein CapA [Magnetovibrio sp.]|nr:capsule biosynthesis protein CapA [Magnetovibrio sp.]
MLYEAENGDFVLGAVGDAILSRPISVFKEQRFLDMIELLRSTDCTFANLEILFHEYEHPPAYLDGTHAQADPEILEDLKWAGIDIVSLANNHAYNFGYEGILTTIKHLKKYRIPNSGAGANLQDARMPCFLDTSRGRIGLVSVNSTFEPHWRAGEQRPDMQGRPGINCLGFETSYTVDQQALNELQRISHGIGWETQKEWYNTEHYYGRIYDDTNTRFHVFDKIFELGDTFRLNTSCNSKDLQDNLKWIRAAKKQADFVLVSLHSHEQGESPELPAGFAREFAYEAIDAGANAVVGHGYHHLRGIEIYKNCPIFHSLGDFFFQEENFMRYPQESYDRMGLGMDAIAPDWMSARSANETRGFPADPSIWRTVIAIVNWKNWNIKEILLYPIDLGFGTSWGQRGRPMLADKKTGGEILENLRALSSVYGTDVEIKNNVGIISFS